MKYKREGKNILYGDRLIHTLSGPSTADEIVVSLQTAYNEGVSKGLLDGEDKFYRAKYRSESNHNFRWVLYIILAVSLIGLVLAFTTLPAGWLLIALATSFTAGGSLYGLGRIERVTF